jgi:hypothetical protein
MAQVPRDESDRDFFLLSLISLTVGIGCLWIAGLMAVNGNIRNLLIFGAAGLVLCIGSTVYGIRILRRSAGAREDSVWQALYHLFIWRG